MSKRENDIEVQPEVEPRSKIFKVDFDIYDYKDILPSYKEYIKHDEVINEDHCNKGRLDLCVWKKYKPSAAELGSHDFKLQEVRRVLKTGAWVFVKEEIIWLPPPYYFSLQYGKVADIDLEFRIKRLKHVYFKIRARNNPACKGTFTVKNRGDGETTMSMHDCMWECMDGGSMNAGQIGIQSKTRADAFNPCWMTVQTIWQSIPRWLKEEVYNDFSSGDNIAEKLRFMRDADEAKGIAARNIIMQYYPSVYNAMDGRHNMKKSVLDEVLKWVECSFSETLSCYSKFIMPGGLRKGMFDIFSSPPEKDCQSYREGRLIWEDSDPNQMTENGTTKSRLHRYMSDPLEGIEGFYDEYGDADANKIYDHIMMERKNKRREELLGEIRGYPLTEEEMWGSIEAGSIWSNTEGIKARKVYLINRRFKDEKTKEPCRIYGNLERVDGYIDGDVEFRMADTDKFDLDKARFCFSYLPKNRVPLKDIHRPPEYFERMLGFDPSNLRYFAKNIARQSDAAMVVRQFGDIHNTGVYKLAPVMYYCCRPQHQEIIFEDVLRAAIFNRAMVQYENSNDKFENYAEDRGYSAWLLPTIGAPPKSPRKGDAPSGKGRFLLEGISLLDAATNLPLTPEDVYMLEQYWFPDQLTDYLSFNPKETQASNITMADMQSLVGIIKVLHKKIREPSELTEALFDYIFN